MLAGAFRFVCCNGWWSANVCKRHSHLRTKGNAKDEVIEGAFRVLDDFEAVDGSIDDMKAITLKPEEQRAFATAALTLRYGERTEGQPPAPITAEQLNSPRRIEDRGDSLWLTFQRVAREQPAGRPSRSQRARAGAFAPARWAASIEGSD